MSVVAKKLPPCKFGRCDRLFTVRTTEIAGLKKRHASSTLPPPRPLLQADYATRYLSVASSPDPSAGSTHIAQS